MKTAAMIAACLLTLIGCATTAAAAAPCASQLAQWRSPPVAAELRALPQEQAARMLWAIPPPQCVASYWLWQATMKRLIDREPLGPRQARLLRRAIP